MADFPYLPLWTDAYLADTRHLSTEEHGAYLLLLMEAWRRPSCSLPDDDRMLARLTGLSEAEWARIKPVVMDFWTFDGRSKTWVQKRLQLERVKSADRRKVAKEKAAKRWKGRKKSDAGAMPQQCTEDAIQNQNQNQKESPHSPPRGKHGSGSSSSRKKAEKPVEVLCEVLPEETARAFLDHRQKIRKPMTPHAAKLMASKLKAMPDPVGSVNQSILNGWTGVFEVKDAKAQSGSAPHRRKNYGL